MPLKFGGKDIISHVIISLWSFQSDWDDHHHDTICTSPCEWSLDWESQANQSGSFPASHPCAICNLQNIKCKRQWALWKYISQCAMCKINTIKAELGFKTGNYAVTLTYLISSHIHQTNILNKISDQSANDTNLYTSPTSCNLLSLSITWNNWDFQ